MGLKNAIGQKKWVKATACCLFGCLVWLGAILPSGAEPIADRLAAYPYWKRLPPLKQRQGEIHYPDWFAGTWDVTSTLLEQSAPLAPDITSPGFENNQALVEQPIHFTVRFTTERPLPEFTWAIADWVNPEAITLPDRRFNAESIAQAYLGGDQNVTVQLLPHSSPRLITRFSSEAWIMSSVIGFSQAQPDETEFLTTELSSQQFTNQGQQYLNQVETTTAYQHLENGAIAAEQITAIYLSPQDPDYFQTQNQPIALYRYQLTLQPVDPSSTDQHNVILKEY